MDIRMPKCFFINNSHITTNSKSFFLHKIEISFQLTTTATKQHIFFLYPALLIGLAFANTLLPVYCYTPLHNFITIRSKIYLNNVIKEESLLDKYCCLRCCYFVDPTPLTSQFSQNINSMAVKRLSQGQQFTGSGQGKKNVRQPKKVHSTISKKQSVDNLKVQEANIGKKVQRVAKPRTNRKTRISSVSNQNKLTGNKQKRLIPYTKPENEQESADGVNTLEQQNVQSTCIDELLDKNARYYVLKALSTKHRKYVGAHISASGGPQNSPLNCFKIGGQAFALFLKNQRRWDSSPLDLSNVELFKLHCKMMDFPYEKYVLPHCSYLINLANADDEKRQRSYNAFLDDLKRCEKLGISLCNFHPGSTVGSCERTVSIKNIAHCINKAHEETKSVKCVIENMSGQKNMIASKFEEMKSIIDLVLDKSRVGVCLDTCHLYAAGYDITTIGKFDSVMKDFDRIVGLQYLSGMHLNDSKAGLNSGLDRHENIGKGMLGTECFQFIMTDRRFENIPLILETPDVKDDGHIWADEIQMLYKYMLETRDHR